MVIIMGSIRAAVQVIVQGTMTDTIQQTARTSTKAGQAVWYIQEPGPPHINPVQLQVVRDPHIANQAVQTGETMFIQTGRVLYIAKKGIAGKHAKTDPGKKAMCRQREQQIQTDAARVQRGHQHGPQLLRPLHGVQPHAVPLPAVHLKGVAITGVERAAGAIRAVVVSWAGNHRLAARAASERIHTRRASRLRKRARPADRGVLPQKVLHVLLHQEVAAGQKAVPEVKKGVKLPIRIS